MQVKGYSSDKVLLNVPLPDGEGLHFNRGEIVRGMVEDLKGNGLIQIQLKGISIEAQTEVPVQAGQELYLYVDDFREGRTFLRVVSPELMENIENRNISSNLSGIGVKVRDETVEAARKLIQHHLPVTRENLNCLLRAAALAGGSDARNLEVAAFAMARGIDESVRSLVAIKEFVNLPRNVARLVEEALQLLERVQGERATTGSPAGAVIARGAETGLSAGQNIPGPRLGSNAQPSGGPVLVQHGQGMDASAEQRVAGKGPDSLAVNEIAVNRVDVLGLKGTVNLTREVHGAALGSRGMVNTGLPVPRLMPWLQSLLQLLGGFQQVQLREESGFDALRLQEVVRGEKEVIRALVLAREVIQNDPELARHPVLREVLARLRAAEQELGGQRIFNALDGKVQGQDNFNPAYYFAIPLKVNGEHHLCQLKIFKEAGEDKPRGEAGEFRLVVSLDTARLGTVLFHVTCRKQSLYLQGVVEREGSRRVLEKNLPHLVQALQGLGYRVENGSIKVAGEKELVVRPHLTKARSKIRPLGIDIRV